MTVALIVIAIISWIAVGVLAFRLLMFVKPSFKKDPGLEGMFTYAVIWGAVFAIVALVIVACILISRGFALFIILLRKAGGMET